MGWRSLRLEHGSGERGHSAAEWSLDSHRKSERWRARAACTSATGPTNEVTWQAGMATMTLQTSTTHGCFLTSVGGAFQGGSEAVSLNKSSGTWTLGGNASQQTLFGASRCILMPSTSDSFVTQFSTPTPLALDSSRTGACYLTFIPVTSGRKAMWWKQNETAAHGSSIAESEGRAHHERPPSALVGMMARACQFCDVLCSSRQIYGTWLASKSRGELLRCATLRQINRIFEVLCSLGVA